MKYEDRGEPVRSLVDLQNWVRSRRVRLSVRYLKKKNVYEVVARAESHRGKHHIRTLDTDLTVAMGTTVDTMNDYIEYET
jgi:hypothetical protein